MPFLHSRAVRHWLLFMAVLLTLGLVDLSLQAPFREAGIITFAIVAWLTLLVAGLLVIALVQGSRSVRMHRTHGRG
jgi:high-affinity Fe2+/Pb2+ permease